MTHLWDKPLPGPNDYSDGPVYQGVGRVCSAWELVELSFSILYVTFHGQEPTEASLRVYGRNARSALARLSLLEAAGEDYFNRHPCQDKEGEFASLVSTARRLVVRRNQIVHGMLMGLIVTDGSRDANGEMMRQIAWCIASPMHAVEPLTQGEGHYYFGSHALGEFADRFAKFAARIGSLANAISPPSS